MLLLLFFFTDIAVEHPQELEFLLFGYTLLSFADGPSYFDLISINAIQ